MITEGTLCTPTPEAWLAFQERTGACKGKEPLPQPVVLVLDHPPFIEHVQLAFPFWWWKEEDLVEIKPVKTKKGTSK